jgi:hypothetical protein
MLRPFQRNQVFETKSLINFNCRLSWREKTIAKMKVYPGMLLKTNDRNWTDWEEPGMCMKNKLLIAWNRECS